MAAVCVRLGIWQLARRQERRALNAQTLAQLSAPERPMIELIRGEGPIKRRAVLVGTPDTANEFAFTGRSRNGSPGVNIFTPMRIAGNDTAVLVNRGWVYAPDAKTADLARWREQRTEYHGYVLAVEYWPGAPPPPDELHKVRRLTNAHVQRALPYPVSDYYLVAQDSASVDSTPARIPQPSLDEGPHLNYAIQWFCFATIALVGAAVVARRSSATTNATALNRDDTEGSEGSDKTNQ